MSSEPNDPKFSSQASSKEGFAKDRTSVEPPPQAPRNAPSAPIFSTEQTGSVPQAQPVPKTHEREIKRVASTPIDSSVFKSSSPDAMVPTKWPYWNAVKAAAAFIVVLMGFFANSFQTRDGVKSLLKPEVPKAQIVTDSTPIKPVTIVQTVPEGRPSALDGKDSTILALRANEERRARQELAARDSIIAEREGRIAKKDSVISTQMEIAFKALFGPMTTLDQGPPAVRISLQSDSMNARFRQLAADSAGKFATIRLTTTCPGVEVNVALYYKALTGRWTTSGWWRVKTGETISTSAYSTANTIGIYAVADGNKEWNGSSVPNSERVFRRTVSQGFVDDGADWPIIGVKTVAFRLYSGVTTTGYYSHNFNCDNL